MTKYPLVLIIDETTGTNSECRNYFIRIDYQYRSLESNDPRRKTGTRIDFSFRPFIIRSFIQTMKPLLARVLLSRYTRRGINASRKNGYRTHFSSRIRKERIDTADRLRILTIIGGQMANVCILAKLLYLLLPKWDGSHG